MIRGNLYNSQNREYSKNLIKNKKIKDYGKRKL